jgi:hypothetical protein
VASAHTRQHDLAIIDTDGHVPRVEPVIHGERLADVLSQAIVALVVVARAMPAVVI